MKKLSALVIPLLLVAAIADAQSAAPVAPGDSIKLAISKFAASLRTSDGRAYLRCFADSSVTVETMVYDKKGMPQLRRESIMSNANAVNQAPAGALLEQVEFGSVKTDGPLGHAWISYKFYYDGKLQYCGVQSFQFIRLQGVWKIFYLVETRYTNKCT
jgi:ketosteroid isomerase-like protein